MTPSSSDSRQICPECGAIQGPNAYTCLSCRHTLPGPAARPRSAAPLISLDRFAPLLKIVAALAVVALILGGVVWLFKSLHQQAVDAHPHPADPIETTTRFFTALHTQDYHACGHLMPGKFKALKQLDKTGVGHNPYFNRIRRYLIERAGPDFVDQMQVSPGGRQATFANGIVLTVTMSRSQDLDDNTRYGFAGLYEFPFDADLGLGINARNRQLGLAIDGHDELDADPDYFDGIIAQRRNEPPHARLRRLINTYPYVTFLDVRHQLLEWIITEFPDERRTHRFLNSLIRGEEESPQLLALAQAALPTSD